jgi:hypothetical protein
MIRIRTRPGRGPRHRTYQPRDTEHSVIHTVIREHLEPFLREASDRGDGHGLPRFVEQKFREFLTAGCN